MAIISASLSFPQGNFDDSFGFPDDETLEQRQGFINVDPNQQRPPFNNNFPPLTAGPSTTTVTVPPQSTTPRAATTRSPAFRQCLTTCLTTNEYNPVCGSDNVNYDNARKLDCANFCGPRVNSNWEGKVRLCEVY